MAKLRASRTSPRSSKPSTSPVPKFSKEFKRAHLKARQRLSSNKARDAKQREELDDLLPQLAQAEQLPANPLREAKKSGRRTDVSKALDGLENLHT
ncbi:hypothetical protein CBS14141_000139 [Malassezia furfur]|nr:hypothetical protein CBS14141_000139 [Malassezia furfur]